MNLLRHLSDQLHHNRIVHRNQTRLVDLCAKFDSEDDLANRAVLAMQIGARVESQADHLDASWLARLTTALPTPSALRSAAAEWFRRSDALFAEAVKS